ncbi:MAG TPA: cupin-like domain-containing protein, partial [Puia sp.]|nr:cupin-like domain-containing protein [Puia sp.]
FKDNYGHYTKEVKGVTYTFAEFMDLMVASTEEKPCPYPFNLNIENYFPELMKDIRPEVVFGKIDRVNHPLLPRFMMRGTDVYEFFLGGAGSAFPFLHIDALFLHNQATQLYGTKDFIIYPPEQAIFFYPSKENPKHSPINVLNPDYDKYPLFKEAQPLRVTLKKGETLIFPSGWWHYTQMYGPSISMGRVHLNAENWNMYVADESREWKERSKIVGNLVYLYGKVLGKVMDLQEIFV